MGGDVVRALALGVVAAFAGGFGTGRWTAPEPPVPFSAPSLPTPMPSMAWRACPPPESAACDDLELALQFCEAQLAVSRVDQSQPRFPWDSTEGLAGVEPPEVWVPTIEAVFAECDIPADLVAVDCSEPPCVGGVRVHAPAEEVDRALHDCTRFHEHFGEDRGGIMPVVTRCPDGSVQRMHLLATYDDDEVDAYFQATGIRDADEDGEFDLWFEGFRILARRTDALASQWDCSP